MEDHIHYVSFLLKSVAAVCTIIAQTLPQTQHSNHTCSAMSLACSEDRTDNASVASVSIIGGGIAGLACASSLVEFGMDVRLFATGQRGVGGLLATRHFFAGESDAAIPCDTACQLFSASHPRFRELCALWEERGWVRRWPGRAVFLRPDGSCRDTQNSREVFVADGGMEYLARQLAVGISSAGASVRTQMWATAAERTRDGRWDVRWDHWSMGVSDYLVVAHSGKCAKRITSSPGLERCHAALKGVQLGVMWCVCFVFADRLGLPFEIGIVEHGRVLSWVGNQTEKLRAGSGSPSTSECWALLSSNEYGWKNKVPQEFVPAGKAESVAADMLAAFASLAKAQGCELPPVQRQYVQLWGAGPPSNTLQEADAVFDPITRAGVCADWCVSPCVEGAVLSGLILADLIWAHHARAPGAARAHHPPGQPRFEPSRRASAIAAFPGWLDPSTSSSSTVAAARRPVLLPGKATIGESCSSAGSRASRWRRAAHTTAPLEVSPAQIPERQQRRWARACGVRNDPALASDKTERPSTGPCLDKCLQMAVTVDELQPGMLLLRGLLTESAQQWVADAALEAGGAGKGPRPRSTGFYRAARGGGLELNAAQEGRGSFVRHLSACDPLFSEICLRCFAAAAAVASPGTLPELDAQACAFNFYEEGSRGIPWHRDIDETNEGLRNGTGRPVVSISLGDDGDFQYRAQRFDDPVQSLRLRSGDVLVFGGPSRGIPHAMTRVFPGTRAGTLRMVPGRLNLTFRHHV
ncbi:unnamed protein product [Prorocentrum cordatum]|uniref:Fe2OG dioxygenase domain-containing protein n=1 Tax=Prorocentrum cordatum TaxID=2364126 RepID=A0ABN9SWC3_9DINO|nr:unnamed protein product [Polarella glacialis]